MAINKKLIHFESFVNFNSKKLSANKENNTYTIGVEGPIQNGDPEILYQSIVYIKDTKQQWTHGLLYNETIIKDKLIDLGVNLTSVDIDEEVVESPLMEYATVGYVDKAIEEIKDNQTGGDLSDYAKKTDLDKKVDKVTGKQLSTEDFTTVLKNKLNGLSNYDDSSIVSAIEDLQEQLDSLETGNNSELTETVQLLQNQLNNLPSVATSGSYNDLIDKPTIPNAITENTVSEWGFTKNPGTYIKPNGGIPKSDLASIVQTSLDKADTALLSYTEKYQGTVKGVKINGSTKSPNSNGIVDLGTIEGGTGGGSSNGGAELMVEVTYDVLVEMRNNSELIPGMKYRMIDYETVLPANDTWHSVAGHHFDLILTALDEKTLSERCSAIQSARDTEGYFANNNLGAWEIHYCLDNDTNRFGWAVGTRPAIKVDLSSSGMSTITVPYSGGFVDKGSYYCRWDATIEGENVSFLTLGDATGNIMESNNTLYRLVPSYVDGSLANVTIDKVGTVDDVTFITDERGKGVIYRMIDEYQNDVYYDFKNVIITKNHLLAGIDNWYTFTYLEEEEGGIIIDASNCGMCRNNLIKSSYGLLFNCITPLDEITYVSDVQLGSNCFSCMVMGSNITIGNVCTYISISMSTLISIGNMCSNIIIFVDTTLSIVDFVSGTFDNPVSFGLTMLTVPCARKIAQNINGQVVMFVEGDFTEPEILWQPKVDEENP